MLILQEGNRDIEDDRTGGACRYRTDSSARLGCIHQFAESLGNTVDAKDPLTFNHSREVAKISESLACSLGLSEGDVDLIHLAGHLHDIGKIGIPDAILKKTGRLSAGEWEWIKRHPEIGARIVRPVASFGGRGGVSDMILYHHEAFDGSGYPFGLQGREIPIGARIIAVADTLSALLQDRPYRPGTGFEQAMAEMRRCAGSQFDPLVIGILETETDRIRELFSQNSSGVPGELPACASR